MHSQKNERNKNELRPQYNEKVQGENLEIKVKMQYLYASAPHPVPRSRNRRKFHHNHVLLLTLSSQPGFNNFPGKYRTNPRRGSREDNITLLESHKLRDV